MAYNPFNIFRRNQRTIFAVVTVFIMFTFVLSSGLGGGNDFFDWFPRWLSGKSRKGDQLCTIDGTKVYDSEVRNLRFQRVMASKFMELAAGQTLDNLHRALNEQMVQGSPEFKIFFQMALQNPMQMGGLSEMIKNNPKAKQADKDAANTVEVISRLYQNLFLPRVAGTYFAMAPNRNTRDLVDFLLWEKKADQLGIRFTTEDVKTLIQQEFMGQFKNDVPVREALQKEVQGFSLEACLKALAAEFRVRAAQSVLLGDRTLATSPVFSPPYEVFEFYRDKTSPTAYEVLAVPAANFVGQVGETPSEADLQRLFNERKDYEPDPSREEPGFREPRKVKVEWVSATGEEPYYQNAAREWVTRAEQLVKSEVWGLMVPVPGSGVGSRAALAVGPVAAKEPLVQGRYKQFVVDRHWTTVDYRWGGTTTFVLPMDLLDTSVVRAQNLAAAAGGGAAMAAGFGNALLPPGLLYSATLAAEQRDRVKAGLPLVLGPVPGPGLLATAVGGLAKYEAAKPKPLPVDAVKSELLKEVTASKARELAIADMKKLQQEVNKLTDNGRAKDKGPAKAYIDEFVKARGLKTGATANFVSEWTVGDDPGLAPLKAAKDKGLDGRDPHANLQGIGPVRFGRQFFYTTEQTGARAPATGTYKPEFYPEKGAETATLSLDKSEPVFLAWRTAEEPARGVTYQQARPKVLEAWKLNKARAVAKAEAERLANDIRNYAGTSPVQFVPHMRDLQEQLQARFPDPKAKERVRLFRLDNVAPEQITPDFTGRSSGNVTPFQLAPSSDIPYPSKEMQKTLLEERTKPAKTVLVMADQPQDTYYVFVLAERKEKTVADYRAQMLGSGLSRNPIEQTVVREYQSESANKAQKSVLALIKKEFNYVETEAQKKLLDERAQKGEE